MPPPAFSAVLPLPAAVLDLTAPRGFAGLQARPGQEISTAQALAGAAGGAEATMGLATLPAGSDGATPQAGRLPAAAASPGEISLAQEKNDGLSVTLVRDPEGRSAGLVAVLVAKALLESGKSFGFPLPAELARLPGIEKAQFSMADGSRLPKWLAYNAAARAFSVSAVPSGALPLQIAVRIGGQRWTLTLSER
jgi:hypothetical protein